VLATHLSTVGRYVEVLRSRHHTRDMLRVKQRAAFGRTSIEVLRENRIDVIADGDMGRDDS
jgi:hypothetical protein